MNKLYSAYAFVIVAMVIAVSACSPLFRSNVITFHEQPMPSGESIRVEAVDPEKANSLEFRNYASLIRDELQKIGYNPVTEDSSNAELIAEVDYSVDLGPTDLVINRNDPFARYHFYAGRYYDPYYFGLYDNWTPEVYSATTYDRTLQLNIVEAGEDGEQERIFEGRVQSAGSQNLLPEVMPYLITAMFSNFPGESGVTKVVTIESEDGGKN